MSSNACSEKRHARMTNTHNDTKRTQTHAHTHTHTHTQHGPSDKRNAVHPENGREFASAQSLGQREIEK
jgi:hypothetical protein